jgi:hypothetical protein
MTGSRLKLYVSLFVVCSHIAAFFGVVLLRALVLPKVDIFEIIGSLVPLFGVFLVVIVKDTIKGREDLSIGRVQSTQMVSLTFILLGAYILAIAMTLVMVGYQSVQPSELPRWFAVIESALGTSLGLIIDDLFGGKGTSVDVKPARATRRTV